MNLGVVIQSESGNVSVRHQAARFSGGIKTLFQMIEVVYARIEMDNARTQKPLFD